jgi:hypothetical protein
MKPSIGRIVHVLIEPAINNGTDVAAAVITRVWSDDMVNVTVLPDCGQPLYKSSIPLCANRADADDRGGEQRYAAFWPPRA